MKNLENEYKDFFEQETSLIDADALWNRIEAALPGKENEQEEEAPKVADFPAKLKWYRQPRYISLLGSLVAVFIVAIIVSSTNITEKVTSAKSESASNLNTTVAEAVGETADYEQCEETFTEAEPTDSQEIYEESSEGCIQTIIVETEFVILSDEGEWYSCKATASNEILEEGTEFFIPADDSLEVGNAYIMELTTTDLDEEKIFFEIFKKTP